MHIPYRPDALQHNGMTNSEIVMKCMAVRYERSLVN